MRVLPSDEHQSRKEKILQAVVHLYIKTGKPVGSSTIVESFNLNLSAATIRNVLADLERDGFLTHPHTSAGRIPTDKGYRTYVDSIMHIQNLALEEEKRIRAEYSRRMKEVEDLMVSTTRVLSALSQCTGFVLPPVMGNDRLRRLEIIPLSGKQILGILISEAGVVRNQVMNVDQAPNEETLRMVSRFLSDRLAGLSFNEAQSRLITEMDNFNAGQFAKQEFLSSLSRELFNMPVKNDLYFEGTSNMLNFPELQDYESIRSFANLVDEKQALGEVLTRELSRQGIQVKIGSEDLPELKHFSVVSSWYQVRGRPVGVLGILGPKRMEYARMMSIVNTVASLVNRFLDNSGPELLEEKK
jgi:heat-inducible transcriptional repressor